MTSELVDIELDRLIDGQARSQYRQGSPKMFTVDAKARAKPLGLWKPRTRDASRRPERPFSAS